ncbi:hypothetical protein NL533_36595, partial [Klebsiella pneumoniae]|nr:hypothetical protein [Klebsiella pneumoniae]
LAAGLPPSAVFAAEFAILVGGVQAGWILAAIAAATLLAAGFAAIAFHVVRLGWGRPRPRVPVVRPGAGQAVAVLVP